MGGSWLSLAQNWGQEGAQCRGLTVVLPEWLLQSRGRPPLVLLHRDAKLTEAGLRTSPQEREKSKIELVRKGTEGMDTVRLSGLRPGEKEMGSAFCALQGKGAKDPGQGVEVQRNDSSWEDRGLLQKGGRATTWQRTEEWSRGHEQDLEMGKRTTEHR